ncbi:BLUF domain-containing protein [Sphingomonas aracearum]|uniref:Activator of photopigment and puc with BLUF domain protein n=1 Tax=Sphingomonas aracearum TaxID=2283317 RepID=A0A369VWQ9_9SPHN|nr:BLUF domain-containing protein [Sphingomonas aracearum]RDE06826.1 activator of photopigment and puc with BLUF domain protein [Sphingomonas aracearum]
MLQLVYISSARNAPDVEAILAVSRRNNARDSITGLLYSDGVRFLQVLEGPEDKVEAAFARIQQNPWHRAIVARSRRHVETREFGLWQMAHRSPGGDGDAFVAKLEPMLARADKNVRATFESFAKIKRAA